jgi:PAS domain S-box-containing protein
MNPKKPKSLLSGIVIHPKLGGLLIGLLVLILGMFMVLLRMEIIHKSKQKEMNNLLTVVQKNIEQALQNSSNATLSLALTANTNFEIDDFETVSKEILKQNPQIDAVQLVPNGIITKVFPLEGNESVIGYNILDSQTDPLVRYEAQMAIKNKKMYFAGPFQLKQGGIGIVGRLPIFKKGEFWGFVAVVIRLESLINSSGINKIKGERYYFQLSKVNPLTLEEQFYLDSPTDFNEKNYQADNFTDSNWKLYVVEKRKYGIWLELLPSISLALLLAMVSGSFAYFIFKRPHELRRLVQIQSRQLIKSEGLFKTIFDKAAIGIAKINSTNFKLSEVNDRFAEILGYTPQELQNKSLPDITQSCDYVLIQEKESQLRSGEIQEYKVEIRLQSKEGKEIWVNLTVSALSDANKNSDLNVAIIEDITVKKYSENQIIESNKRLKSLFDDSPIPLWEEDFSDVKKHLNSLGLIGLPKKDIENYMVQHPDLVFECINKIKILRLNQNCLLLHEAESVEQLMVHFDKIMTDDALETIKKQIITICRNKSKFETDSKIKTLNGKEKYIHLQWNVISGYEDNLERVIITTEDITERKLAQINSEESQKKLNALINSIDGIVWEYIPENETFSFISDKVSDILGYDKEEWLNNKQFWENHIHPEDREDILDKFKNLNTINNALDCEYRMITRSGKTIWVRDIINYISHETSTNVTIRGIIIDITNSKQIEKNLNQSLELVTKHNQRLFNFSHIVSHNLRSHTSNIQSIINLLDITIEPKEREELLDMLKTVSSDLDESVHHLNEITNIYTNIDVEKRKIQLKLAVENILFGLSNIITLLKADVTNNLSHKILVEHNPSYLDNIILNFLLFILKNKDLKSAPIIKIQSYEEDLYTVLEIADQGKGTNKKETSNKIFNLFHVVDNDSNLNHGFGLFIAKSQIEALNGKILIENKDEETLFKIYFK